MAEPGLRVAMVGPPSPSEGNVTGTPAHIRKIALALGRLGATVQLTEIDLGARPSPLGAAVSVVRAWAALSRFKPDVVHAHGHLFAAAVMPWGWLTRVPVMLEVHGLYVESQPGHPGRRPLLSRLAKAMEMCVARRANVVIAQARTMARRLVDMGGVLRERLIVLYPGLVTNDFAPGKASPTPLPGVPSEKKVVMYVGSTHRYQGLELLAAAQQLLGDEVVVALVLSGNPRAATDSVNRIGFRAESTAILTPEHPDEIPSLVARADVLVHARPDIPENMNVQSKLGLYLASGRPLVATNVGDYAELLGGSKGCVLAEPSPSEVAKAIRTALASDEVRVAARTENVELAKEHFESASNAARLLAVMTRAAAGGALQ